MNLKSVDLSANVEKRLLPPGWRWVRLGEVCELNPRRPGLNRNEDALTTFVPMSAVEEAGRGIARVALKPFSEVRKGYTYFGEGDVLFAKITPCMQNGKHAIARNLIDGIGFGTTEFHVLRPRDCVISEWIHHFILQPWILQEATAHFTGAVGQQRVPEEYLAGLDLALPPITEQKRIVAILSEQLASVELARAAAETQLEVAKALPAAYLRSVFNSSEAQRWTRKCLGEVCEITARQVDPRIPEFGALPHVNGENIESSMCRVTYLKTATENGMISGKYIFEPGDVLYSKLRPYLRKAVVADFRGVCSADMYPIRVNKQILNPHFLCWMLVSDEFSKYADAESRRARMPKLNREQLFAWKAPLPSLSVQRCLMSILSVQIAAVERTRKVLEDQLDTINKLSPALLRRAFSGTIVTEVPHA